MFLPLVIKKMCSALEVPQDLKAKVCVYPDLISPCYRGARRLILYSPVLFTTSNLPEKTLGIISIAIKRQGKMLRTSLFISNANEGKNYANTNLLRREMFVTSCDNDVIYK